MLHMLSFCLTSLQRPAGASTCTSSFNSKGVQTRTTHTQLQKHRASIAVHYIHFPAEFIDGVFVEDLKRVPPKYWSDKDVASLYAILRRKAKPHLYDPDYTRVLIEKNRIGARVLINQKGEVKLGSKQYQLDLSNFREVKALFDKLIPYIPPPTHFKESERSKKLRRELQWRRDHGLPANVWDVQHR